MARIAFLDCTTPYNGLTYRERSLGGIQCGTVELSEALASRGNEVMVFNLTDTQLDHAGVSWCPLSLLREAQTEFDLAIANNSAKMLTCVSAKKRVTWFRNRTNVWRCIRRGELPYYLRLRPHGVMLSQYHLTVIPRLLPLRSRQIIEHGTNAAFRRNGHAEVAPKPKAIFASQPYRGLDWVLEVWRKNVQPTVPDAELHIFVPKDHQVAPLLKHQGGNIFIRGSIPPNELAREFQSSRVLLIPGHIDETYCRTAAEAAASGLPVVTRGIGSLGERLIDNQTGFLARGAEDFGERVRTVLTQDSLWLRMSHAAQDSQLARSWQEMALIWERTFLEPEPHWKGMNG